MTTRIKSVLYGRRRLALATAAILTLWAVSGTAVPASAQDAKLAPAPAKTATSATKPTSVDNKNAPSKKAQAKKQTAKKPVGAVTTCEPTRVFVPVQKAAAVCTPAASQKAELQKFNTVEDIYVPPPPEKK